MATKCTECRGRRGGRGGGWRSRWRGGRGRGRASGWRSPGGRRLRFSRALAVKLRPGLSVQCAGGLGGLVFCAAFLANRLRCGRAGQRQTDNGRKNRGSDKLGRGAKRLRKSKRHGVSSNAIVVNQRGAGASGVDLPSKIMGRQFTIGSCPTQKAARADAPAAGRRGFWKMRVRAGRWPRRRPRRRSRSPACRCPRQANSARKPSTSPARRRTFQHP